jgi:ORF6N domain
MGKEKPAGRIENLEPLIFTVRGRRVILDSDLAHVYGVPTKALNQAVKRNTNRFPGDFAFQLDDAEAGGLRSQFVTSTSQVADSEGFLGNRSQSVTGSRKHRDPAARPWVFTEHGALMAANILRSEQAVRMSVYVIRAFVHLREEVAANSAILKRLAEIDRTLLQHDTALRDIYRRLLPLLQPPSDPPKRRIGFHTGGE